MSETISCCMIVRDDEHTLEDCLRSVRPHVDHLVVVDTGSSDASPEIARRYADTWELFLGANDSEGRIADFAMARNKSFELAKGTSIFWVDGDDVLRGGEHLRAIAEHAATQGDYTQVLFQYEYSRDASGNVTTLQMRERLLRPPHAWVWQSPVHEYATVTEPGAAVVTIPSDLVVVEHRSDVASKAGKVREPQRNLRILKDYIARVGERADVRALYYLGVEYAAAGDIPQALRYIRLYSRLSDWDDERCRAMLWMAEFYLRGGDYEMAIRWAQDAMTTKSWPEPWFVMGRAFYAMAANLKERPEYNYRRAAYHLKKGLEHPTDIVLFANPQDRHYIHATLNVCLHALGRNEEALQSCEEGLRGCPPELRAAIEENPAQYEQHPFALMLNNRREYLKGGKLIQVRKDIGELQALGALSEQQVALIRAVLKNELRVETEEGRQGLPGPAAVPTSETRPQETRADPGKLDIVLFLGPALERWTPLTWEQNGMGGSETMALHMARRLRKLGHRVRFFTDCSPSQEGVYEGVEWCAWQRFRDVECDVLIASRFPWAVDDQVSVNGVVIGGCKAKTSLLWVHDVTAGPDLDLRRGTRYDRILCLSEWHREYFLSRYPGHPGLAEKVHVTRNGIDLSRFDGDEPRNPHHAVYSSSPDRGLLAAVMAWPKVRESVPDAELHVYYGFLNWQKSAEMAGAQDQLGAIAHLKQLCRATPGVVMHDRVGQKELAREFMRRGVWAYGTGFHETSCLTAMEAQASGLLMVTSGIGALVETAGANASFLKNKWESWPNPPTAEFVAEYAAEIVEAMTMPESDMAEFRQRAKDYARAHFGLDELAEEWSTMLEAMVAELAENPVPAFVEKGAAE